MIYVMQSEEMDAVKVGISVNPTNRARQLRRELAPDIFVRATLDSCPRCRDLLVERLAHLILRKRRNGATEWFRVTPQQAWRVIQIARAWLHFALAGHRPSLDRLSRLLGRPVQWSPEEDAP